MASRSSFQIREGNCVNIGVDDKLGNLREVVGSAVGLRTSPRSLNLDSVEAAAEDDEEEDDDYDDAHSLQLASTEASRSSGLWRFVPSMCNVVHYSFFVFLYSTLHVSA
jgi:hypothetical protein